MCACTSAWQPTPVPGCWGGPACDLKVLQVPTEFFGGTAETPLCHHKRSHVELPLSSGLPAAHAVCTAVSVQVPPVQPRPPTCSMFYPLILQGSLTRQLRRGGPGCQTCVGPLLQCESPSVMLLQASQAWSWAVGQGRGLAGRTADAHLHATPVTLSLPPAGSVRRQSSSARECGPHPPIALHT